MTPGQGIDGSVLGWAVGTLTLAALIAIAMAVEFWRFGRDCMPGGVGCEHAEAGK